MLTQLMFFELWQPCTCVRSVGCTAVCLNAVPTGSTQERQPIWNLLYWKSARFVDVMRWRSTMSVVIIPRFWRLWMITTFWGSEDWGQIHLDLYLTQRILKVAPVSKHWPIPTISCSPTAFASPLLGSDPTNFTLMLHLFSLLHHPS